MDLKVSLRESSESKRAGMSLLDCGARVKITTKLMQIFFARSGARGYSQPPEGIWIVKEGRF